MLTKAKPSHPLNGMQHTSGLFSDMSLDGPEIGTLVAIVDRGKNLPNRKTMGKQDPYCHVRLGKEAKKTSTDVRGGQTPRWDQELRFDVHDSPDYFQLKASVFTDDKKTDLIGETWIDLRDIIVSGGGQSDKWHSLTCRSKYAGEIRMEITFYDSRPKPKQPSVSMQREDVQRVTTKRRPLPSDPVTGQTPAPPAPQHIQTPPRPLPGQQVFIPTQSPLQAVEYHTSPSGRPRGPQQIPQVPQSIPQAGGLYSPHSPHPQSGGGFAHTSQIQAAEAPIPTPPQRTMREPTPPQPTPIENHDPYANDYQYDDQYSPGYQGQAGPPQHSQQIQQYDQTDPRYDSRYDNTQGSFSSSGLHELPSTEDPMQYPPEDDRPPPPPAHRTLHSTSQDISYRSSPDVSLVKGTPPTMRHDVLRNEAHRSSFHASAAYPGRPQYKPNESAPPAVPQHGSVDSRRDEYHPSPPRHHSYDAQYDDHHRSMQPTVEDMPDSPPSAQQKSYKQSDFRVPQYESSDFVEASSPAPLNVSGRNSAASGMSGQRSPSAVSHPRDADYEPNYRNSPSPIPPDYRRSSTGPSPNQSFNGSQRGRYMSKSELENNELAIVPHKSSSSYRAPEVPPSLIPGVDPHIVQDITERLYEDRHPERRFTQQELSTPTRRPQQNTDRRTSMDPRNSLDHGNGVEQRGTLDYRSSLDYRGSMDHRGSYGASSAGQYAEPYTAPDWQDDNRALTYAGSSYSAAHSGYDNRPVSRPRGTSPAPQQTIKRKSVSPAPPPENRRHSGLPFGPDSYDEFNPAVAQAKADNPDYSDPDSKIITHDGREVDPSDHLPMSSWAPEPDKMPKETTPDPRSRPSPAGAQPMPSSGRRQIRVQARPQSMAISSQSYADSDSNPEPSNSSRNRLHKRPTHRMSGLPASSTSSGPLVPIDNTPGGSGFTPPRHLSRASTFDYSGSENREPVYGSSPGNRGDYRGDYRSNYGARDDGYDRGYRPSVSGPAIPAKAPLQLTMSGANGEQDDEWALMQEMQNIDLGSGRSRRHQGY